MTGFLNRRPSGRQALLVVLVLISLVAALLLARLVSENGSTNRSVRSVPGDSSVATAGKKICPSLQPATLPAGMSAQDRQLVPFSSTVLGVTATWADANATRSIEVLDGGYVDDITEPYDGLVAARSADVNGSTATVLTTIFLERRVYVGYWRESSVQRPCDVHALTTLGLKGGEFYAVLRSLR